MSGFDKIVARVNSETDARREKIKEAARAEAEKIMEASRLAAGEKRALMLEGARADASSALAMAKSSADLKSRQAVLSGRIGLIESVIEKALAEVKVYPDGKYFDTLIKLAGIYASDKDGVIFLSRRDLDRIPASFTARLKEATGRKLEAAPSPYDIDGGFILSYGDIEVNCSFDALLSAKRDILKTAAATVLFA